MDENGTARPRRHRTWLKRVGIAVGVLVLLLAVFHRPLLLTIGRRVAIHFAAKENIKLDCRLEGSIFTSLVIRNLHATPSGPTIVESIDADYIRADYSLLALWRQGASEFLKNIEVRSVHAVLDPAKATLVPDPPNPNKKITLPVIFPERLLISDVNLRVRSTTDAGDLIVERFDLELNPVAPGELRVAKLQIPGMPPWSPLTARTTYAKKNLVLSGLTLDADNQIRLLAFDASHIKDKRLELALDSSVAGGTLAGSIALSQTAQSLDVKTRLVAADVSLDKINAYLAKPPGFLAGTVDRVEIVTSGAIDAPRTWDGIVTAQANSVQAGGLIIDRCALNITAHNGIATVNTGEIVQGLNSIRIAGNAELPADVAALGRTPASLQITGAVPDLRAFTAGMPQPLTGSATLTARADIQAAVLRADASVETSALSYGPTTADGMRATFTLTRQMPPPDAKKLYYTDLHTKAHVDVTNIRSGEYVVDSVQADISSADDLVRLEQLLITRNQNTVTARGEYRLPADFAQAKLQPAIVDLAIQIPQLGDFWMDESPNRVTGPLEANGQIRLQNGVADGAVSLFSSNLRSRELVVQELSSEVTIARNVVYLNDLTATLNDRDYVRANGNFALDAPHRYGGSLSVNVANLATFEPVLAAAGNKSELAGSLVIDWRGSGEAAAFNNSGNLKLNLAKGRFGNMNALEARVDANYSPEGLDVPIVYFGSDKMTLQADARTTASALEISNVQVDQGKAKYATGYVSVPFIWKNIGSDRAALDPDGKVAINFESQNLDIKKLTDDLGLEPVGSGLVSLKVDAQGTLANLGARLDMQMRDLRAKALTNFDPASFELTAQVQNNQLTINGKLKQARIQPLSIDAKLPLNIAKIIEEKKFDEDTPVSAKVQLPRSSVNFLRQFAKGVEQLDGDVTLDVNVNGTIAKPVLSGSGDMTVNLMRFSNATLPALRGFKTRLVFDRDTLTFERFGGELAGGPFTLAGRVTFPKLTEPTFDLQLRANAVLVARSDDLTARADADIRVTGPLASASVTGTVALTNSQFLKNLDLIPIGLPGRPAPRPQPPSTSQAELSFPDPPLRDWKFDVAIKTKDPFLIKGNLATGGAIVDLHLGGTGLHPALEGSVRLEKVEATLPFSRLEISQGFVYFDPSDALNPKLDLQGVSLIRDYTIHVYVYGTANAPEAVFTSEPPLPQEEIISLLATGTTREELLGGGNVLAGKAAMLLVTQLYRKVFKKGEATKSNPMFDNLQVDVGTVDPRTGQQTATAKYKVNEKVQLIGDLAVGGDFRGMVKYLIRFR